MEPIQNSPTPPTPVTPTSAPPSPVNPVSAVGNNQTPPMEYAGFGRRWGASIIDGFILMLVNLSVGFSLGLGGMRAGSLTSLIGFLIAVGYVIFFWVNQNGQTLGKRAMAIRIVKENGQPVDLATAVIRYIGYIISSIVLLLGYIWVLFDAKKQGWHDKIAKTYVIKTEGKPKTWLAVLCFVLPVLFIFIFTATMAFLAATGKISKTDFAKIFAPTLTRDRLENKAQSVDATIVNKTFNDVATAVDKYRKDNGLPAFEADNRLCAYARRRLEQLSKIENGWYDAGKGFYEDTADQNIWRAYFLEYAQVFENVHQMRYLLTGNEVVKQWTQGEKANLKNKDITHACIQADSKSIVFIGGIKKK